MTVRLIANLVTFALVSAVVIVWAARTLFGGGAEQMLRVTAELDGAGGLQVASDVTFLGQSIGRVTGVDLGADAVEVRLEVEPGTDLPSDVTATVRRRSAVGEPFVDLAPVRDDPSSGRSADDAPRRPLADGDVIPRERTALPLAYAELFESVADLFDVVDPDDVQVVLDEITLALEGRAPAIQRILRDGAATTRTLADGTDVLDRAITEVGDLTTLLADESGTIAGTIDDLASVSGDLGSLSDELEALVADEDTFLPRIADLVATSRRDLGCTLVSLAAVGDALDGPTLGTLERVLLLSAPVRDIILASRDERGDATWLTVELLFTDVTPPTGGGTPAPTPATLGGCEPARGLTTTLGDAADGAGGAADDLGPVGAGVPPSGDGDDGPDTADLRATSDEEVTRDTPPIVAAILAALALAAVTAARPWRWLRRSSV